MFKTIFKGKSLYILEGTAFFFFPHIFFFFHSSAVFLVNLFCWFFPRCWQLKCEQVLAEPSLTLSSKYYVCFPSSPELAFLEAEIGKVPRFSLLQPLRKEQCWCALEMASGNCFSDNSGLESKSQIPSFLNERNRRNFTFGTTWDLLISLLDTLRKSSNPPFGTVSFEIQVSHILRKRRPHWNGKYSFNNTRSPFV